MTTGRRLTFGAISLGLGLTLFAGVAPQALGAKQEHGYLSSASLPPPGDGVSLVPFLVGVAVLLSVLLVWSYFTVKALQRKVKESEQANLEIEKELDLAQRSVRNAQKSKQEFLSNMSHEFRTPLNAILGMSQLALDSGLSGKQQRYIKRVQSAGNALLEAVNQVLDFTNAKSGNLQIEWVECNLETILTPVARVLGERAQNKGILFCIDLDLAIPKVIDADSVRLTQVLMALGDNAVKFTEQGEVKLTVALESCEESGLQIRFTIQDSGIGIKRKALEQLFLPFTQADNSLSRQQEGRGLGLTLAHELVALMGDELKAQSRYGEGSVFSFKLPCHSGLRETSRIGGAWQRSLSAKSVLVISSNQTLTANVKNVLIYAGATVSRWVGIDDINNKKASLTDGTYAHVIVDWEYTEPALRSHLTTAFHDAADALPPILLLSHLNHTLDIPDVRPDFTFTWLTMPILPSSLMRALTEDAGLLSPVSHHRIVRDDEVELGEYTDVELAVKDKVVLLVEDNLINQEVALGALETLPLNILVANNGAEAIEVVKLHHVDLVLMDIQMPVVDGISATKTIRAELGMADLPILAMTANTDAHDVAACRAAGMNEHLAKPIDFELLRSKLAEWLRKTESATPRSTSNETDEAAESHPMLEPETEPETTHTGAVSSNTVPPTAGDTPNTQRRKVMEFDDTMFDLMVDNVPGINLGEGVQRLGGNKGKYLKILSLFLTSQAKAMEQLLSADTSADDKAIIAHSCKGAGSNIGAGEMSAVAAQLEDKYNSGVDVPESDVIALKSMVVAALDAFNAIAESAATMEEVETEPENIQPLDAYLVQQINALLVSLQEFDIGVQDKVTALAKDLPQWCNQLEEFKRLQESVNQFDFLTAEEHLKALKKKTG